SANLRLDARQHSLTLQLNGITRTNSIPRWSHISSKGPEPKWTGRANGANILGRPAWRLWDLVSMQVGLEGSASRPISRYRHGVFSCAGCCETGPAVFSATGVPATKKAPKRKTDNAKTNAVAAKPHRIDVHHHIVPPRYIADMGLKWV